MPCLKTASLLLATLLLLMAISYPAAAAEPASGLLDSGGGEIPEVSSVPELMDWLSSNQKIGGTVRLKNDLTVGPDEYYSYCGWLGDPDLNILAGEHTIFVAGRLELWPYVNIQGAGGEAGILHVEKGGYLEIINVPLTVDSGYAIYQEEGAVLSTVTVPGSGEIHYSEKPVAWPAYDKGLYYNRIWDLPYAVIPAGQDPVPSDLPQDDLSTVNWNGNTEEKKLPVIWDDLENHQEAIANRESFLLQGRYAGGEVSYREPPSCLVVLQQEDAAVFLPCLARPGSSEQDLNVQLQFQLDNPFSEYQAEWSPDGSRWFPIEEDAGCVERVDLTLLDESIILYAFFQNFTEKPRYFSITVTGPDGRERHSDILELTYKDGKYQWLNGGGRNGETLPGVPEEENLPPTSGNAILKAPPPEPLEKLPEESLEIIDNTWVPLSPMAHPEAGIPVETTPDGHPTPKNPLPGIILPEEAAVAGEKRTDAESPPSLATQGQPQPEPGARYGTSSGGPAEAAQPDVPPPRAEQTLSENSASKMSPSTQSAAAVLLISLIGFPVYYGPIRKGISSWKRK